MTLPGDAARLTREDKMDYLLCPLVMAELSMRCNAPLTQSFPIADYYARLLNRASGTCLY